MDWQFIESDPPERPEGELVLDLYQEQTVLGVVGLDRLLLRPRALGARLELRGLHAEHRLEVRLDGVGLAWISAEGAEGEIMVPWQWPLEVWISDGRLMSLRARPRAAPAALVVAEEAADAALDPILASIPKIPD